MRKKLLTLVASILATFGAFHAEAQKVGDRVTVDGKEYLLGQNLILNSSFENGYIGWNAGDGNNITNTTFTVVPTGGVNNGAWIHSNGHTGLNGANSIKTAWSIEAGANYYFSVWSNNTWTGANPYAVFSITKTIGEEPKKLIGDGATVGSSIHGNLKKSTNGSWVQNTCSFNSEEYTYFQACIRWMGDPAAERVKNGFDEFYLARLYDPNEMSEEDLVNMELNVYLNELTAYKETELSDYLGMGTILDDIMLEYGEPGSTAEETKANIVKLQEAHQQAIKGLAAAKELETLCNKAENIINGGETYPGIDAFTEVYAKVDEYIQDKENTTAEQYINAIGELNQAILTYRLSQEANADKPANYTFFVTRPTFNKQDAPSSYTAEQFTAGTHPTPDATGWISERKKADGSAASGGDFRSGANQLKTCYNSWSNDFASMQLYQDLTNLPNGYYAISCNAITQPGCANDQHAFVSSSAATAVSPILAEGLWDNTNGNSGNGIWTLQTTEKVLVSDGKLRIGYASTYNPQNEAAMTQNGWFNVTDFTLYYYGAAGLEVLQEAFNGKMKILKDSIPAVYYKGDKKALEAIVAQHEGASDEATLNAGLDAVNKGIDLAVTTIAKRKAVLVGSYKQINDTINSAKLSSELTVILQSVISHADEIQLADTCSYTHIDAMTACQRAYLNNLIPVWTSAEATQTAYTSEQAKALLQETMTSVAGHLKNSLCTEAKVNEYIAKIKEAKTVADATELLFTNATDFTALIVNPKIDGTDNNALPSGWSGYKTNGNTYSATGQGMDGKSSNRYLDSWNGTAGALAYNMHQNVTNLPNGKYRVKAALRTSGDKGAYVYAFADGDSTTTQLSMAVLEKHRFYNPETQTYDDATISDTYGSIWEDANAAMLAGNATPEQVSIYKTNPVTGGYTENLGNVYHWLDVTTAIDSCYIGRGWQYKEVEIEVKNHELTLGFTTDSTFTKKYGGDAFTGTWISCDNFSLTMIEAGDNTGWAPSSDNVTSVENKNETLKVTVVNGKITANQPIQVYSISGQHVNSQSKLIKGLYIVKGINSATKILVK